ncbi:LORF2 protein, partial [Crocuta crocuta]
IRERQIKTARRYHLIPVRMTITKKTRDKCPWGVMIWEHLYTCKLGSATMENSMEFPQKLKNGTTIFPIIPTSGYPTKGNEIKILKRYLHPMFIVLLFTMAKIW